MNNKPEFDAVLIQCAIDTAPTIADYKKALELLENADTKLDPIRYGENNTFAGGFITKSAGEKIDYCVGEHGPFGLKIRDILSDKNKETEDGVYTIEGLRVAILYTGAENNQKEEDNTKNNKPEFDAVLIQCSIDTAPTIADYKKALELLENADTRLYPIHHGALSVFNRHKNIFAGGFITESASKKIDYLFGELDPFGLKISDILSDKNNEDKDGVYTVEGLRVAILNTEAENS